MQPPSKVNRVPDANAYSQRKETDTIKGTDLERRAASIGTQHMQPKAKEEVVLNPLRNRINRQVKQNTFSERDPKKKG